MDRLTITLMLAFAAVLTGGLALSVWRLGGPKPAARRIARMAEDSTLLEDFRRVTRR